MNALQSFIAGLPLPIIMNYTHVIAFLVGALAQGVLTIILCELDYREQRDLLRSIDADSVFEKPISASADETK